MRYRPRRAERRARRDRPRRRARISPWPPCSAMPEFSNTFADARRSPAPTVGCKRSILPQHARLKLSAEDISGLGAPFCTATPIDERAISTGGCGHDLAARDQVLCATLQGSPCRPPHPRPRAFQHQYGPSITARRLPSRARSERQPLRTTIFHGVVLSTLTSIGEAMRSPVILLAQNRAQNPAPIADADGTRQRSTLCEVLAMRHQIARGRGAALCIGATMSLY